MKFEARDGSTFTNDDMKVIGPEILRIAKERGYKTFRSLTSEELYDEVFSKKNHVLRKFFTADRDEAAKAHWIEQCRKMIGAICIVQADIKPVRPRPLFVTAPNVPRGEIRDGVRVTQRAFVVSSDTANDPAIQHKIMEQRMIAVRNAFSSFERLMEQNYSLPPGYSRWASDVRAAFDTLEATLEKDAAE